MENKNEAVMRNSSHARSLFQRNLLNQVLTNSRKLKIKWYSIIASKTFSSIYIKHKSEAVVRNSTDARSLFKRNLVNQVLTNSRKMRIKCYGVIASKIFFPDIDESKALNNGSGEINF